MNETIELTCPDLECPAHGRFWTVELDEEGAPLDESELACAECYGPSIVVEVAQ